MVCPSATVTAHDVVVSSVTGVPRRVVMTAPTTSTMATPATTSAAMIFFHGTRLAILATVRAVAGSTSGSGGDV